MFTTLGSWKYCVVGKQIITTLFLHVQQHGSMTTLDDDKNNTTLPKHWFVQLKQQSALFFVRCALLWFPIMFFVAMILGSGWRIATMVPLCDEALVATHFHCKNPQIWFGNFFGWLLDVYEMFFSWHVLVMSWWIISVMPLVSWRCNGAAMWRIFCWSHLELNRISRFVMNNLFSVWEFVCGDGATVLLWLWCRSRLSIH